MRVSVLLLLLALLATVPMAAAAPEDPLAAVAFLVGTFEGTGRHPYGPYEETQRGTRGLAGTTIEIRTESKMGERVVHEDLRVVSWDPKAGALRMRQWAPGILRVYTGAVGSDEAVTFQETSREGESPIAEDGPWRYVFRPKPAGGFTYEVEVLRGDKAWKRFVSGDLAPAVKDPGAGGGLGMRQYDVEVAGMRAQVHHPDGAGPYPALVFSPGGSAKSFQGYRPYGRWYATWGYITVIVAFEDESAAERAPKFTRVLDWVVGEHTREDSPLRGMVDVAHLAVAGHSRGGEAALRAARADARVRACLALAPPGPTDALEGGHAPPACIIVGDKDPFLESATKAYEAWAEEKYLIVVPGMSHMLEPRDATLKLVRRSTAFLNAMLKGEAAYRALLTAEGGGLVIRHAQR